MLAKALIAIAVLLVLFSAVVATRPSQFTVLRGTSIAAPPQVVYAQVADFHKWPAWSPWAKLDPEMKMTFAGTDGSPGATYEWTGNSKVGEGRMTVVNVRATTLFALKLEFLKPFEATNDCTFTFVPTVGGGTQATWAMSGHNGFLQKAFAMFMNMDKMVGGDFERGLASLKQVSEGEAKKAAH